MVGFLEVQCIVPQSYTLRYVTLRYIGTAGLVTIHGKRLWPIVEYCVSIFMEVPEKTTDK